MLSIMKVFSGFGAIIILVVGLAMVGITIYGYLHSEIFLNNLSYRNRIMGTMAVASYLIVFGSALGIYGIKKGNSLMICVFQIYVIIFLIVFFSLGIAAQAMPGKFFDGNCTTSSNPAIAQTNKAFDTSKKNLCLGVCACAMTPQALSKYNSTQRGILNTFYKIDPRGVTNIQGCTAVIGQLDFALAQVLGQVQQFLDCSLWCQASNFPNLFYRFSNVNNGKPQYFCYNELKNQVDKYSGTVGIAAFVAAAFLLLVCACNTCICCHPKRKGLSLKDRFVYMNNGQYTNL